MRVKWKVRVLCEHDRVYSTSAALQAFKRIYQQDPTIKAVIRQQKLLCMWVCHWEWHICVYLPTN